MTSVLGSIFLILGIAFLMMRFVLYKFSNPFDASTDREVKHTPQMIMLLLLSETFMLFGFYFIAFPFPTVTHTTSFNYNSLGGVTGWTNTTYNMTTAPVAQSVQIPLMWFVGFVVTIIIAILIFVDVTKVVASQGRSALELK